LLNVFPKKLLKEISIYILQMSLYDLEILETEERGNTINLSSSPPKQPLQYIHHFFTWNNYYPQDIETLLSLFHHIAYDFVFQEEIGDSGTPHLQGTVSLKSRKRWTEFELPKVIHWEKVAHVPDSYQYCSDPDKRFGGCWSLRYPIPDKLDILHYTQLKSWQLDVMEYLTSRPDDRTIWWLWSASGGIGKSSFCKYLVHTLHAVVCGKGKYSDIMNIMFKANMVRTNVVVFDLPRNNGNKISYSALESIKNGLIVNTKYETGSKLFNSPHIIVFSNMPPVTDAMSTDRWVVRCLD